MYYFDNITTATATDLLELCRSTLKRLEQSESLAQDDPSLCALKRWLVETIANFEYERALGLYKAA